MAKTNIKTVSLVLGSGGARGLAHIGVIHWLEENDYNIRSIAGSSIGALRRATDRGSADSLYCCCNRHEGPEGNMDKVRQAF